MTWIKMYTLNYINNNLPISNQKIFFETNIYKHNKILSE